MYSQLDGKNGVQLKAAKTTKLPPISASQRVKGTRQRVPVPRTQR
ncbi:MAG: hypothetical protein NVS4B10_12110 [Myxococcales bacterium]